MLRAALRRSLNAVEAGELNCVVVYKVDRLSRSLLDFTRMLSVFEQDKVSFVGFTNRSTAARPSTGSSSRDFTRPAGNADAGIETRGSPNPGGGPSSFDAYGTCSNHALQVRPVSGRLSPGWWSASRL